MDRRQSLAWLGAAVVTPVAQAQMQGSAAAPHLNLVVPVPPGGSVDLTARLLGEIGRAHV